MEYIYLGYGIFVVLLLILFGISYLHYKTKKGYFVLVGVILFVIQYIYLTNLFYSYFIGGGWNMTGMIYGIILLIIVILYIIFSFFKDKVLFLGFTTFFCFLSFIYTLPLLNDELDKKKINAFNSFTQHIIDNPDKITEEDKKRLLLPTINNSRYDWKINNENIKKAKQIVGLYDFEYCKENKSDECYLNFIKGKTGLDGYKNFTDKYNQFIEKYGKYIKKEIIFKGLEKDLREEIKKEYKAQLKNILIEIGIQPNNKDNVYSNFEVIINKDRIGLRLWGHDYFKVQNKETITEKRIFIKKLLDNLKLNYLNNLVYNEDRGTITSTRNGIKNVKITGSGIKVFFKDNLEISINIGKDDILYTYYSINYKTYLSNEKYRKDFFNNSRLIFYYFVQDRIGPYIDHLKVYNFGPDMKFSYSLNAKYSGNVINKQTLEEILKEKDERFIDKKEDFIIKNNYNFNELLNNKELIDTIALKYNIIGDDEKIYFRKVVKKYYESKGFIFKSDLLINQFYTGKNGYYIIPEKYILKVPKDSFKDYLWFAYKKEGVGNLKLLQK